MSGLLLYNALCEVVNMIKKVFSKTFIFFLAGQTLSMFGTNIIKFAISLYILEVTTSAAIFGWITAASYIPPIILSPFGGILADRKNKKNLMVALDGIYGMITLLMGIAFQRREEFGIVAGLLILLSIVSAFEAPVVQSSVPLIQTNENLTKANAIVNQITSLSGLLAPFLAGIFYSIFGKEYFHYIMFLCTVCFLLAASVELHLTIPLQIQHCYDSMVDVFKYDFKDTLRLILKEKQHIGAVMLLNAFFMFLIQPFLSIGVPYIISVKLELDSVWNGGVQVFLGILGIAGGFVATAITGKFQIKNIYKLFIGMGLAMIPVSLMILKHNSAKKTYFILSLSAGAIIFLASIAGTYIVSGIQKVSPQNMLGRVMAIFATINNCALPIGVWLYGIIYEKFDKQLFGVLIITAVFIIFGSIKGKKIYWILQQEYN